MEDITVPRILTNRGKKVDYVNVTMPIRQEHFVLLSVVAEQWGMSLPELIENFASKLFARDIVKINTIVKYLRLQSFSISDIAAYLKLGEHNERRIEYLRRQGYRPDGTREEK